MEEGSEECSLRAQTAGGQEDEAGPLTPGLQYQAEELKSAQPELREGSPQGGAGVPDTCFRRVTQTGEWGGGSRRWETSEEATALVLEEKMGIKMQAVALMEWGKDGCEGTLEGGLMKWL